MCIQHMITDFGAEGHKPYLPSVKPPTSISCNPWRRGAEQEAAAEFADWRDYVLLRARVVWIYSRVFVLVKTAL